MFKGAGSQPRNGGVLGFRVILGPDFREWDEMGNIWLDRCPLLRCSIASLTLGVGGSKS